MKWYLAGPMTGIPSFNFPAFLSAAADLRERGFEIISPAELDNKETFEAAMRSPDGTPTSVSETWGDLLARDVKIVADQVGGIVFLPDWQRSRGARLEAFVGVLCNRHFAEYVGGPEGISHRPKAWVTWRLTESMGVRPGAQY